MIDHQKQDQKPSWKINFHRAKTLHEKREKKRNSYENHYIQKKIHKEIKVRIIDLREH
jgi:hypothetical protein